MLMNNSISFSTEGKEDIYTSAIGTVHDMTKKGIKFKNFETRHNTRTGKNISNGDIKVGDTTITIHFADRNEITAFCTKHNIEHKDGV